MSSELHDAVMAVGTVGLFLPGVFVLMVPPLAWCICLVTLFLVPVAYRCKGDLGILLLLGVSATTVAIILNQGLESSCQAVAWTNVTDRFGTCSRYGGAP